MDKEEPQILCVFLIKKLRKKVRIQYQEKNTPFYSRRGHESTNEKLRKVYRLRAKKRLSKKERYIKITNLHREESIKVNRAMEEHKVPTYIQRLT